jgi:polygalacturonase
MAYQTNAFETVSVKEFGAKGDGVTDDTAAIQRAFNTLAGLVSRRMPASARLRVVRRADEFRV